MRDDQKKIMSISSNMVWFATKYGFFSIVKKPSEYHGGEERYLNNWVRKYGVDL